MKLKKAIKATLWILIILTGLFVTAYLWMARGRPERTPLKQTLYEGVTYRRRIQNEPKPVVIHVIKIDMKTEGLSFIVTPPDDLGGEYPIRARTTSQFLDEFNVQIAINGDNFLPWWSHTPLYYYPHAGDPVVPRGDATSRGVTYSGELKPRPTLYITAKNQLRFDEPARPYNAISGDSMLVVAGKIVTDLDDPVAHPRTMIGYSKTARFLYLVIVDGRQPFYSMGTDLEESAQLMIDLGAYYAMNLDGGGSSTMVIEGANGEPVILNSPIDSRIPGRERPVANHLGIFINP
jgi:hypothetical protein